MTDTFRFSKRQPFCNNSCKLKFYLSLFFTLYLSLTAVLYLLVSPSYQSYVLYSLIIPFNLALILYLGRTLTYTILFPYSNCCYSLYEKKRQSYAYNQDFVNKLEQIADSVELMIKEGKKYNVNNTNTKMSQCELIKLYIEINSKIKGNRVINAVTRSMERIRDLLKQIEIDLTPMNQKNKIQMNEIQSMNIWDMYAQEVDE